jgi:hypothetical protein
MTPNKITGANSRPASPLDAGRPFGSPSCAPPSLSAAVAQVLSLGGAGRQALPLPILTTTWQDRG